MVRVAAGLTAATAAGSSNTNRTTDASATRLRGSFSRQRRTTVCTDCGTSAGIDDQSGSLLSTVASTSGMSSPSNGRLPVSISNSTQPRAQMSARLSTGRPFACSGAM